MATEKRITSLGDTRVTTLGNTRVVLEGGRAIEEALADAFTAPLVFPFGAVEMLFDSSPLRLWTGVGNLTLNTQTFLGAGTLLAMSLVEETTQLKAAGMDITLSGQASGLISLALQEKYSGRTVRAYMGGLNTGTGALIGGQQLFVGYADQMIIEQDSEDIEEGGGTTIVLHCDHEFTRLEGKREPRYTSESQRGRYDGDTFFDYVAWLQDREIIWRSG